MLGIGEGTASALRTWTSCAFCPKDLDQCSPFCRPREPLVQVLGAEGTDSSAFPFITSKGFPMADIALRESVRFLAWNLPLPLQAVAGMEREFLPRKAPSK
jgi:hypothetical protein